LRDLATRGQAAGRAEAGDERGTGCDGRGTGESRRHEVTGGWVGEAGRDPDSEGLTACVAQATVRRTQQWLPRDWTAGAGFM
jgi:hypothetical protein